MLKLGVALGSEVTLYANFVRENAEITHETSVKQTW